MKKARAPITHCLNCNFEYGKEKYDFCPDCGQKRNSRLTIANLFENLLNSLFSFDSSLLNTLGPFLFSPGNVTLSYIDGKRKRFVGPTQLYFFFSFVLFLLLSSLYLKTWEENLLNAINNPESNLTFSIGDSEVPLQQASIDDEVERINNLLDSESITESEKVELQEGLKEVEQISDFHNKISSLIDEGKTNQEIYEELTPQEDWDKMDRFANYFYYNILRNKGEGFLLSFFSQLAVGLAVALVLLTISLRLLYIRRPFSTAEHFVHMMYFFSFLFILIVFGIVGKEFTGWIWWNAFIPLAGLTYFLISIKQVYKQNWLKTIFKYILLLGLTVWIILPVSFSAIFLLSMLKYSQ